MTKYNINNYEGPELPNKLGLSSSEEIDQEEFIGFAKVRQDAIDKLTEETVFDLEYLYTLHREALEHLYTFAGDLRTVNMSKGDFAFPAANFLEGNLREFEEKYLTRINNEEWETRESLLDFLAAMHAELLYLHPFREGNGRVIRLFTQLIYLAKTGDELDLDLLNQGDNFERYIAAVQQAATGEYGLMQELFSELKS